MGYIEKKGAINMKCTFFGHSDTPKEIEETLRKTIIELIENKGVNTFYVGTHGNFDAMVYKILCDAEREYGIKFFVVLPCVPTNSKYKDYDNTIVPQGIEKISPRFGIDYRNKWMIKNSDYVITYVARPFGGASKFEEYAKKQEKAVMNIA